MARPNVAGTRIRIRAHCTACSRPTLGEDSSRAAGEAVPRPGVRCGEDKPAPRADGGLRAAAVGKPMLRGGGDEAAAGLRAANSACGPTRPSSAGAAAAASTGGASGSHRKTTSSGRRLEGSASRRTVSVSPSSYTSLNCAHASVSSAGDARRGAGAHLAGALVVARHGGRVKDAVVPFNLDAPPAVQAALRVGVQRAAAGRRAAHAAERRGCVVAKVEKAVVIAAAGRKRRRQSQSSTQAGIGAHVSSSLGSTSRRVKMPTRVSPVPPSTQRCVSQLGSHALLIRRDTLPL